MRIKGFIKIQFKIGQPKEGEANPSFCLAAVPRKIHTRTQL